MIRLERNQDKQNCSYVKLIKTLDLLARPRGFEPLTLGLEMQGIGYTNDLVLRVLLFYNIYFTTCLRKWLKDSFTCS